MSPTDLSAVGTRGRAHAERVLTVQEQGGTLVVERMGGPFRKRYVVLIVLLIAVLALLIGYLLASRINPRLWFLAALVLVVLLALAERAYRMYQGTKPDRFVFDKANDRIERNGVEVGRTEEAEAVLFREVLDGDRPLNEFAVVVSYENTRRLLVAETHGLPGEKESIEETARAIAAYLDVPVRNEPRQAEQWWIDRS